MPADQTRVLKRTLEILNLSEAGGYAATLSTRNKTRNIDAITDLVIEAGLDLLRVLGETPNEYRSLLTNTLTPVHGAQLPEHVGDPVFVEIQKYDSKPNWEPAERRDYKKVNAYRLNTDNIYDSLDHDVADSPLAGYYDIWEQRFYFTGFAARIGLVQIVRADTATKIPETLEPTWVRLAVGNSAKAGDGTYSQSMAGVYGQRGQNDLEDFKAGRRGFAEISDTEPTSAVHI